MYIYIYIASHFQYATICTYMSLLILCLSSLATTVDSAGRVAPTNPQLMQAPTESSSTNVSSDYASSGQLCYL